MESTTRSIAQRWNLKELKSALNVDQSAPWRASRMLVGGTPDNSNPLAANLRMVVLWMAPGANAMGRYHVHYRADNLYYILSGELTAIIGGVRFRARSGQAIFMPRNVPHATGNFGESEVYLWELYSPSTDLPDGSHDSFPVDDPHQVTESVTGEENGVRVWDLADLPEHDETGPLPWRASRILLDGGNRGARDQVTHTTEALLQRFAPGENRIGPYHLHHKSDNVWLVIRGHLRSMVGGAQQVTGAGEVILMPAGVPHATGNGSGEEMVALEIYSPSTYDSVGNRDSEPVAFS